MGYNIKDFLQKPLPFLGKEGKTMLIGFVSVLMVLILIGPQFGLNWINLDSKFILFINIPSMADFCYTNSFLINVINHSVISDSKPILTQTFIGQMT